ncbi:nesprin-4 isoform X2 [Rattus rattus]|uniref:nesprin-4 isoform X2 n=1 Tax=Rattus rattus TaxID=10117 RepID=UPI0013F39645|nr:nesprin-4 isoform X2 [Rattus rattus]
MAQFPPLGHGFPPEPVNHPLGGPRGLDVAGPTICPAPEEEPSRPEQVQASLDAPEQFVDEPESAESATSPSKLPLASSHEHQDGGKPCEALQAELQGAAERVDALLVFGEGLAERSEPRAWTSLEQVLRALGTHRDTIFQRLWQLQAQLISYSLVLEKANLLDQDLEVEGDSDGPAAGGVWGPWAPSIFPTPAELEWDPAGDVGGLGPSGQKISRIPGAPCELCGYRGSQSSGQGFEDLLSLGLGHRKHLAAHHRRRLQKPQDKKRQGSPSLPDAMLEVDRGVPAPASRRPLTLLLLLLFLLLVGATLLLPLSGVPCCSHTRLARTPYLVLSYVNGLPPI